MTHDSFIRAHITSAINWPALQPQLQVIRNVIAPGSAWREMLFQTARRELQQHEPNSTCLRLDGLYQKALHKRDNLSRLRLISQVRFEKKTYVRVIFGWGFR